MKIIDLVLLASLLTLPTLLSGQNGSVVVRPLADPGSFEIRNSGAEIELASAVEVEQLQDGEWRHPRTKLTLAESCPKAAMASCVTLARDAVLHPVAWTGFSCSSQCETRCKKNVYLGPGTFRFVVLSCDRKRRFESDSFRLPALPQSGKGSSSTCAPAKPQ